MSLLEIITKASSTADQLTSESNYPIILNPDPILLNLKPQSEEHSNENSLLQRVAGWNISQTDSQAIELGQKFFKQLNRKLKNPVSFNKEEFIGMLNSYLEKAREKIGMSTGVESTGDGGCTYACILIRKVGFLMGSAVKALVLEACIVFEIWELLETLIVTGLVELSCSRNLVHNLIQKRRSDLICLCVKHVLDLQMADVLLILKYFLAPPKDAYTSMVDVRKEWESQALLAIDKATDGSLVGKKLSLAKDASILLMIAHDDFSVSELCLHYLLASAHLDEVIFSFCISKLNGSEMMGFVRYLGKWLRKYEKFPQACPCPKASSTLGLKACEWIPTLENVVKCLGLVLDEHFSSLVMYPDLQGELKTIKSVVSSLSSEAKVCSSLAKLTGNLKIELNG